MKLTKSQLVELHRYQQQLREQRDHLEREYRAALTAIGQAVVNYTHAVRLHNAMLVEVRKFVETVAEELRDAYDEKSDRWKESDVGQAVESMVSEWEDASLHDVEEMQILTPDPPDFDESLNLPEESD